MSPGESIIHDDAGEMKSNILHALAKDFGVDYRGIKGGRPCENGQAESAVKLLKNKIKMIALDRGEADDNKWPAEWDGMVLQNALQMLRCDPTRATGFAPAELMIGRKLVYPVEFSTSFSAIDFTGTRMTAPLVQKLMQIRRENFKVATKKIKKAQVTYKKKYDKRMNAKHFQLKLGARSNIKGMFRATH